MSLVAPVLIRPTPPRADLISREIFPNMRPDMVARSLHVPATDENDKRCGFLQAPLERNPVAIGIMRTMEGILGVTEEIQHSPLVQMLHRELWESQAPGIHVELPDADAATQLQLPGTMLTYSLLQRAALNTRIVTSDDARKFTRRAVSGRTDIRFSKIELAEANHADVSGLIANRILFGDPSTGELFYRELANMTARMHQTLTAGGYSQVDAQAIVLRYTRELMSLRNTLTNRIVRGGPGDATAYPPNDIRSFWVKSIDPNQYRQSVDFPLKHPLRGLIRTTHFDGIDGSIPTIALMDVPLGMKPDDVQALSDIQTEQERITLGRFSLALQGK